MIVLARAKAYYYIRSVIILKRFLSIFDNIIDRIVSVAGAIILMQLPAFIHQYVNVLSGALLEATRQVNAFKDQARLTGKNLSQLIAKHLQSADPDFQATGRIMEEAVTRKEHYEQVLNLLTNSSSFTKPFHFLMNMDWSMVKAVKFEPALPLNTEGIIYGIAGVLLALFIYHGIIKLPYYMYQAGARKK